jgi:hypothetical protein
MADEFESELRAWGIILAAIVAMVGTWGAWRRGLETLGIGHSFSFPVALLADFILIIVLLASEAMFPSPGSGHRLRTGIILIIVSLGLKLGVIYMYGWTSLRGGGDWWDLF